MEEEIKNKNILYEYDELKVKKSGIITDLGSFLFENIESIKYEKNSALGTIFGIIIMLVVCVFLVWWIQIIVVLVCLWMFDSMLIGKRYVVTVKLKEPQNNLTEVKIENLAENTAIQLVDFFNKIVNNEIVDNYHFDKEKFSKKNRIIYLIPILFLFYFIYLTYQYANEPRKDVKVYDNGKYEGMMLADEEHGKGIFIWKDGTKYDGDWINGLRDGVGIFTWPNGNKYVGDWKDDERTGKGTFTWTSGNKYTGDFIKNERTGKGTFIWNDGDKYVGDFVDGKFHGKGVYLWTSGNQYEGDWKDDVRIGEGTFIWTDGTKYKGSYYNDKRHGKGTYYNKDGTVLKVNYNHGKRVY